jgi:hypothetical protein
VKTNSKKFTALFTIILFFIVAIFGIFSFSGMEHHQTRGGKWPTPDLTIEEDLIDLGWHQREFEFKTSFAFTIMNKDESECLGCIYFYPPRAGMSSAKSEEGYDVNVSWWITQKFYDQGAYDEVCWDIRNWIEKEWPFKRVSFSNKQLPDGFSKELVII